MWFRYSILLFFVSSFLFSLKAQHRQVGNPYITNYNKTDINAGSQNFTAVQDKNGRMYFGNGMGVVVFNGNHWQLVEVDNNSYVRSLAIDSNDRIYVGAYHEFGYLDVDESGNLKYHSLLPLINEDIDNFADIWKINIINDVVYFQSYYCILAYQNNSISIIRPVNEFVFSFNVGNQLYTSDKGLGLCRLAGNSVKLVNNGDYFANMEIRSMLPMFGNNILIGTRQHGFFIFNEGRISEWNQIVSNEMIIQKLSCGVKIDNERLAFGTVQNGVVITDYTGNEIMSLTTDQNLGANVIENLYSDQSNNLWIVHNLGVDYAEISSPYRILATGIGSGFASLLHNNIIYLGTNRGLYWANWHQLGQINQESYSLVPLTVGQVWNICKYKEHLLLGHHEGAFLIKGNVAEKISSVQGNWQFLELAGLPGYILAGTYTGYSLLQEDNEGIRFLRKIDGFSESCRISIIDSDGYIWMSHGWKGIYRLKLNQALDAFDEIRYFNSEKGLPSNLYNDIFSYNSKVFISSLDGIYTYNSNTDQMEKDNRMSGYFDFSQSLSKIVVAPDKKIWNFSEGKAGLLTILNDTIFLNDFMALSFIKDKVIPPFESLYWYENENMFIGTNNGFIHFQPDQALTKPVDASTEISYFEAIGGKSKLRFGGDLFRNNKQYPDIDIPFKENFIRISVSANFYSNPQATQYRYLLEGISETWSSWTTNTTIEFPKLREGSYLLKIESRNYMQEEGAEIAVNFNIMPPWYRTWFAYTGIVMLLLFIIGFTYLLIYRRMERLKKMMAQKQQRLIEEEQRKVQEEKQKTEQELITLRNERLRDEVIHKSKELANSANNIIHKNQVLNEIKADLKLMAEESKNLFVQRKIKGLLRKINKDIENDQGHAVFRANFDKVHENFTNKIRKAHPELTPKDLQLCAYLRMNMSTKEIAPMLNISVRGVEIGRYRLRKKLGLQHDENLTDYILNFN